MGGGGRHQPAQTLSQEQVLKEVATAAALQPMSTAQKLAAVRKISLEEAAATVAEYEVVEPTSKSKSSSSRSSSSSRTRTSRVISMGKDVLHDTCKIDFWS